MVHKAQSRHVDRQTSSSLSVSFVIFIIENISDPINKNSTFSYEIPQTND